MAEYNNTVKITSGRKLVTQQPMDDRLYYNTVADVVNDIAANACVAWYKFMPVYIAELAQWAAWLDIDEASQIPFLANAQIPGTPYVYNDPAFIGTIYENKAYQLYSIVAIPIPHSHVESEITNLDKYSQSQVNQLLAQKQGNLPNNSTSGIAVLHNNAGTLYWAILNILTNPVDNNYNVRTATTWVSIFEPGHTPILGQVPNGTIKLPDTIVLPGAQYVLQNPALLPVNYTCYIIHDGTFSNPIQLSGYPIDGVNYIPSVPFNVPQYQSVLLGVINGQWRTLNRLT